jgi:DNA-binding beta-propeller fold protein YncE/ABC-type branched-subunit amino acid transport system substrate-binding protein
LTVSAESRIGIELAGYRIEAVVGRGGMGVVYRARDLALDRDVALKLLAPELAADRSFRERFLRESRLAASLEHPNVVPVHDAGEIDGQLYLAMRLVDGIDLKKLLVDGPLEPARAVRIAEQTAAALDAAHARGLVHRDVKPSNVLLDQDEHAYLADFGLTRTLGEAAAPLDAVRSLGTSDYVAPEQIRGEQIDGRADQYSLACVLHESLTGTPPFHRGTEVATLYAHLEEAPPAPPGLEDVFTQALAKDPAERYPTCVELVAAARSALGLEPKRTRWTYALAAAGLALLAAALLAYFLTRGGAGGPAASGRLIRIDSATDRVESTIGVGNGPSAVAVDESGVWVANHDDGTVWRIDPAGKAAPLKVQAHGKPADLAVSPEVGDTFVSNGPQDANIALLQRANGQPDQILSLFTGLDFPASARVAVGPSGLWIAAPDGRVGRFVSGAGFAGNATLPRPTDERADVFFSGLAVSRDSAWVIGDPNEPSLWRIDAGTGRLAQTIRLPYAPRDVAVGAGGVWVTSQLADRLLRIDPATGRITADVPTGRGAAGVAVGAGSVWVANAIDHTVMRIDPRNLRVLRTIPVDGAPDDLAVGDGSVWLTAQTNPPAKADRRDIKIGVFAACEGQYGFSYDQSLAGAELPLIDRGAHVQAGGPEAGLSGATIAGRKVRLFFACGDDTARKALSEVRRLVESVGVDALIGPTQETESFVIRDYARRHPAVAFLNGSSLGQGVTLKHPAPNFFRFSTDAVQWMAGLGRYAYEQLGWRKAVTVSNSDSFSYTQVAGFVADFCARGGEIVKRIWVPTPTPDDLAPYIAKAPTGVDGFVMTGDTPTTRAFVNGVPFLHGSLARKIVGGYLILFAEDAIGPRLVGVAFGSGQAAYFGVRVPPGPLRHFRTRFARTFPKLAWAAGLTFPSSYADSMEALLQALEKVHGDLSNGERRFQAELAKVELDAPNGRIRLDGNRQAIGASYLSRILPGKKGLLHSTTFKVVPNVDQTFGGYFSGSDPLPGKTTPACRHGTPPPRAVKPAKTR